MKKVLLLVGLCFFYISCYSQWSPDWGSIQGTMSRKQQQYDNGYSQLQRAYTYLLELKLINKENNRILEFYKISVKKEVQDVARVDFSIQANVDAYLKSINSYLDNKTIKDELDLLNKIITEVNNIKTRNPESFTSSDRYKELANVLKELEICDPAEIKNIGWKHGLL